MTDRLRAGIIGTGFIGTVHAHAVRASGQRWPRWRRRRHVVQSKPPSGSGRRRRRQPRRSSTPTTLTSCTSARPTTARAAGQAGPAAGKYVICEKPLATRSQTPEADGPRCRAHRAVAAVPFVYRYYPIVREARGPDRRRRAARSGCCTVRYLQDWLRGRQTNWRVDPASAAPPARSPTSGSHWCDLMEFVTGHRITRLAARMIRFSRAGRTHRRRRRPCCSTPIAAQPAPSSSAKSHRAARTGCGSPWTATTRRTPSTRKPPSTLWVGDART